MLGKLVTHIPDQPLKEINKNKTKFSCKSHLFKNVLVGRVSHLNIPALKSIAGLAIIPALFLAMHLYTFACIEDI